MIIRNQHGSGNTCACVTLVRCCGCAAAVVVAAAAIPSFLPIIQQTNPPNHPKREYAASGVGLSILFQFYRAQPLWIPIGWNAIFLGINLTMIGLLVNERNNAGKLEQDPEQVRGGVRSTRKAFFRPHEVD